MNYLNRMTEINTISDIIYDVKQNITDAQYKSIMDCLMKINNKHQDAIDALQRSRSRNRITNADYENVETDMTEEFFRQFFYHSHKNNNCFYYLYQQQQNIHSLWVSFEQEALQIFPNHQFLYCKTFHCLDKSITVSYARIIKIMPKYCYIEIDNYQKKISNKTLVKIIFFPYIKIFE